MKCPKCKKGELTEHKSADVNEWWLGFAKYKYTYFCPLCGFETKKEIRMTLSDAREHLRNKHSLNIELSKPR